MNYWTRAGICLVIVLISGLPVLAADGFRGIVYAQGSQHKKILFNYTHTPATDDPEHHHRNAYLDLAGKEAVTEEVWMQANGRPKKYIIEQKQLNEKGSIEISGDQAHMVYTRNGKTRKSDAKFTDNSIIGPTVVPFIRSHWKELVSNKKVDARFFALDRLDYFSFVFSKERELDVRGEKQIVIKMKPGNFLVSALVDPLYFHFNTDGSRLLEFDGRIPPKVQVNGQWKDVDAETVYSY